MIIATTGAGVRQIHFSHLAELRQYLKDRKPLYLAREMATRFPQKWWQAEQYTDLIQQFFPFHGDPVHDGKSWSMPGMGKNPITMLRWALDNRGNVLDQTAPIERVKLAFWETCRLERVGEACGLFFIDNNPAHERFDEDELSLSGHLALLARAVARDKEVKSC